MGRQGRDAKVHIALGVLLASVPAAANVHAAYRCGIADSMYNDPEIWAGHLTSVSRSPRMSGGC